MRIGFLVQATWDWASVWIFRNFWCRAPGRVVVVLLYPLNRSLHIGVDSCRRLKLWRWDTSDTLIQDIIILQHLGQLLMLLHWRFTIDGKQLLVHFDKTGAWKLIVEFTGFASIQSVLKSFNCLVNWALLARDLRLEATIDHRVLLLCLDRFLETYTRSSTSFPTRSCSSPCFNNYRRVFQHGRPALPQESVRPILMVLHQAAVTPLPWHLVLVWLFLISIGSLMTVQWTD